MKTLIVKEFDAPTCEGADVLDLSRVELRHCIGCWSCWWKTPGRCVHKDLDAFYRAFLAADKVFFYCKISQGFVTSNLKALIDRMIPLVLPYISWPEGESVHDPRYEKYPAVEIIYRGDFLPGEEDALIAYWKRTFGMLYVKSIGIQRDRASQEAIV